MARRVVSTLIFCVLAFGATLLVQPVGSSGSRVAACVAPAATSIAALIKLAMATRAERIADARSAQAVVA